MADNLSDRLMAALLDLDDALDLLRELHDNQNGPPLPKYAKRWEACMEKTIELLNKHDK